jgi:DNA helicase HerA-like ATPase
LRPPGRAELCAILKIDTPSGIILGLVSTLSIPVPSQRDGEPEIRVAELELIGQLPKNDDESIRSFLRGVFGYSSLGDAVDTATADELRRADMWSDQQAVSIGSLTQDRSIPAMVQVDELVGKHRAILGSTGTGKSCGVAVLLRAILEHKKPSAHASAGHPRRVRPLFRANRRGHHAGRSAAAVLAADLRGAGRGDHRRLERKDTLGGNPRRAYSDRKGALRSQSRP